MNGDVRRVEMYVTIAAAAMIIGKKGSMLKQLHLKSNAIITLDQMQQADGTKRVCVEGSKLAVDIGFKCIQEMVNLCDDAKYEAVTRQRLTDEQSKKQEEDDSLRRHKTERQASEAAKYEAVRREADDETRRLAEEKKWQEKQLKTAKEADDKKKLQAKIAANPFAFLDDGLSEEEEEEEEETRAKPKTPEKRKKKKGKGGAAAPSGHSPEQQRGRGGKPVEEEAEERMRRESNVSLKSAHSTADNDSDDETAADMIGLDKLLQMQEELQPEEMNNSFSSSKLNMSTAAAAPPSKHLEVNSHSSSRRGIAHANEDRSMILDISPFMSDEVVVKFLEGSESEKIPLFLVLDGHGGSGVAEAASSMLPRKIAQALEKLITEKGVTGQEARDLLDEAMSQGFASMEEESIKMFKDGKGDSSGACAVCVVMTDTDGKYVLSVANVGDCRAVVARKEGAKYLGVSLTKDHRATVPTEKTRIESFGGQVKDKRALGDLIPSRTLGDIKTKNKCPGAVSAEPELSRHEVLYREDAALVIASDGLWDELKNAKVMDLLYKHPASAKSAVTAISQAVLKKCAGGERKPNDDLTVVVVSFTWN